MVKKKRKKRAHSDEFKREALRLMETRGDSTVAEIAQSIGVTTGLLYEWKHAFLDSAEETPRTESLEQENERLRRENERLRKESETLKKSIALFAKELKL